LKCHARRNSAPQSLKTLGNLRNRGWLGGRESLKCLFVVSRNFYAVANPCGFSDLARNAVILRLRTFAAGFGFFQSDDTRNVTRRKQFRERSGKKFSGPITARVPPAVVVAIDRRYASIWVAILFSAATGTPSFGRISLFKSTCHVVCLRHTSETGDAVYQEAFPGD
jgi:hypothetical protein